MEETYGQRRAARFTRAMWGHNMEEGSVQRRAVGGGEGNGRMILCFTTQWERIVLACITEGQLVRTHNEIDSSLTLNVCSFHHSKKHQELRAEAHGHGKRTSRGEARRYSEDACVRKRRSGATRQALSAQFRT